MSIQSPEYIAEQQMNILEGMADAWAAEVELGEMIRNATSPMKLNKRAPDDIRRKFHERMMAQVDAIARQSFIEGAYRATCMVQDAYKQATADRLNPIPSSTDLKGE